jgi:two-component system sensor histidine kinase KdpD
MSDLTDPKAHRGDLRILLGAAPGVGKTYAMLREGHRLRAEGHDVVVGYVETHGRAETVSQIGDLEVVPRKIIRHGSLDVPEMDVDAVIRRKPEIVLVDELAHTNAPGSARTKRYEDVEVLRDHGIDVITTVNIQHVAELQDVVASITGIEVHESIPDRILASATDVQLIDLPIEVLLRRLEQGKIYAPERANQALTGFFRQENLTALRELALRRTATGVDHQLSRMMLGQSDAHQSTERILVLASPHVGWPDVLRNAWRLASAAQADLLTLTLAPAGDLEQLSPNERDIYERHHRLARDLAAQVLILADAGGDARDRVEVIVDVIRQERITILVGGIELKRRRFGSSWTGLDLLTDVLKATQGVDLHIVKMRQETSVE